MVKYAFMEREKPGILEKGSYILRNVEIAVAGIALFLGHFGIAALSAIGAGIDHAIGKYLESQREQELV